MPELFRAWAAKEPRARVVLFCAQEAKAPGARKQVVTKFRRLMSDYPSSDRHERTAPTCYADEAKPHLTNGLAGEVGRHPQLQGAVAVGCKHNGMPLRLKRAAHEIGSIRSIFRYEDSNVISLTF